MEGKTARGASSPAKPALQRPEPLSHTRAVVSSSHMVGLAALGAQGDLGEKLARGESGVKERPGDEGSSHSTASSFGVGSVGVLGDGQPCKILCGPCPGIA